MSQLLYFVEGRPRIGLEELHTIGLRYAFPETVHCGDFSGAGPGGSQGCVICTSGDRFGYFPDKQTWLRIPTVDLKGDLPVFVGVWNDERPTPEDLKVDQPLRGYPIKLRDGHNWNVPIARGWSDSDSGGYLNMLPGTLRIDPNGEWQNGGIEPKYTKLWDIATAWWSKVFGTPIDDAGEIKFDFAGVNDAAVTALGANYRIGRAEASVLDLLDNQWYCATQILDALIDRHTVMEWAKKKAKEQATVGSNTSAGEKERLPDIGQP